jgi:hypothetical protein
MLVDLMVVEIKVAILDVLLVDYSVDMMVVE